MPETVTEFLSPAWLAAMADAAERAHGTPTDPGGAGSDHEERSASGSGRPDLVIQQVVTGPNDEVTWFVSVCATAVRVESGHHPDPDITLTQDRGTAAAIASGHQSAQGAFMSGRLRVGGDVRVLLDHQGELARLDHLFVSVRAGTRFPEEG